MLYTHCFMCWASLTSPVFINVPRSVCLVFKMVMTLKRFPMRMNFSKIPLTYGIMTVPWYIVIWRKTIASWWLHYRVNKFFCVFIKHQIMLLISLLKSFWSWHTTLAWLINSEWLPFLSDVGGWTWSAHNNQYE
jgi:hypothetical protein